MRWLAEPSGNRRRGKLFSEAAIQFCLSIKCLFNQLLRQALGMVQDPLKLAGHDCPCQISAPSAVTKRLCRSR